jgi:type IX secretion system substrate protein
MKFLNPKFLKMRTSVLLKTLIKNVTSVICFACVYCAAKGQTTEFVFHNSSLESGTAGADGAVYRFPLVTPQLDALVKITGRSSSSYVKLASIDLTNTGFERSFQPQVSFTYDSSYSTGSEWMEFQITFVQQNTVTPSAIATFSASALDIDGDNKNLNEWDAFYGLSSYTLETNSALQVTNLNSPAGKQFNGTTTGYAGVDTGATTVMTTVNYNNLSSITVRMGSSATNSNVTDARMFSVWFKSFSFIAPITLPVKLLDFTANYAKPNALLNWSTSQEHNFNYFLIERSIDGENFSQVALVFGAGESDRKIDYSYNDKDLKSRGGVIYYRLKQVDIDGKFSYSSVRIIRLVDEKTSVTLTTYPNPVANDLRITLPFSWQNKHVHIDLYNVSGQLVTVQDIGNSSQTESIALASLQKGIYFVQVRNGDEIAQQRIVKN